MRDPLKSLEAAVGKTIKACFKSNVHLILAFADGDWLAIGSSIGFDGDIEAPEVTDDFDVRYEWQAEQFIAAGIMTEADASEWKAKNEAGKLRWQQEEERREREQLERLRSKYDRPR